MYANGFGTERNLTEAKTWFQKAANNGNKQAANALARLKERGL